MTTRQSRSKQALEVRKALARRISTLVKIEKTLRELPETVGVSIYAYETSIYVKGMDQLHDVRRVLKHLNPTYEDQLDSIYPSWDGVKGYAKYKTNLGSPEYRVYVIMGAPIEGFPIKTGEGCGFKEIEIPAVPPRKTITYSCDSSKGE
jgi:hypothetical protein